MFKFLQKIVFISTLFILVGCESVRDEAYDNNSLGVKNIEEAIENQNDLEKYSVNSLEEDSEKNLIEDTHWTKVEADLDQFGIRRLSDDFGYKEYLIDMKFSQNEVLVYADCFEIRAKYKQEGKRVYFSQVSQSIAYELKTCIESEDADQVIYSFLQHDYKIESLKKNSLSLRSVDIDAVIVFRSK